MGAAEDVAAIRAGDDDAVDVDKVVVFTLEPAEIGAQIIGFRGQRDQKACEMPVDFGHAEIPGLVEEQACPFGIHRQDRRPGAVVQGEDVFEFVVANIAQA